MAARADTINRDRLQAFVGACLAPLPEGAPIDTQYNSMLRNARQETWFRQENAYKYYASMSEAHFIAHNSRCRPTVIGSPGFDCDWLEMRRQEYQKLLLTPAWNRASLDWKKRRRKSLKYGADLLAAIDRCIAGDEAFLTAHPTARKRQTRREVV